MLYARGLASKQARIRICGRSETSVITCRVLQREQNHVQDVLLELCIDADR